LVGAFYIVSRFGDFAFHGWSNTTVLASFKEFNPVLHFIAAENDKGFAAQYGTPEVEEYLRGVCVQKYYPEKFWDYLTCRAKNIHSSYWEDCLAQADATKIKNCARGAEGVSLLKENINLNKDLQISSGPTYLLDNQIIFASQGVPDKEEFKKILKR
jgi:hypothetical protein